MKCGDCPELWIPCRDSRACAIREEARSANDKCAWDREELLREIRRGLLRLAQMMNVLAVMLENEEGS
jgi:hypothetical protein